jgi:uncharacterized repeat protein (TIGR03803 family)
MRVRPIVAVIAAIFLSFNIAAAQAVKILYTFQGGASGQNPRTPLTFDSKGNMYGLASNSSGGTNVFELSPSADGVWTYQVIYQFDSGLESESRLVLDTSGNLYGTTFYGGTYNEGIAFELTPSSGGDWIETTLYNFGAAGDGADPEGPLTFGPSGTLYGTTLYGGTSNNGTVYELTPNNNGSWDENILYSFAGVPDGADPAGALTLDSAGNLYGTTATGGNYEFSQCYMSGYIGCGTVYELSPQSGGSWTETVLHNFIGCCLNGNHDGQNPYTGVIIGPGGELYGTAQNGGLCNPGCGVAFELTKKKDGWSETELAKFGSNGNGNGNSPAPGLVSDSKGNLYGATLFGGADANGTLFELARTSKGYQEKILYSFTGDKDGSVPESLVFGPGGKLYGVAFWGGNAVEGNGDGTIFAIEP